MENTNLTHRVAREFVSGDFVHHVGDLVSDADWTPQGKHYVEEMGWAIPLTEAELLELRAEKIEPEPVIDVAPTAKKAPAKRTSPPAKKSVKPTAE